MFGLQLSDTTKGIVYMVLGSTLLLYTLGVLQASLSVVLAILAIAMIVDGFIMARVYSFIMNLINKNKQ